MKNFKLSDLRDLARAGAVHIEATQAALVYCGLRAAPDAGELEKAEKLEALFSLCERSSDPVIVARLREIARAPAALPTRDAYEDDAA